MVGNFFSNHWKTRRPCIAKRWALTQSADAGEAGEKLRVESGFSAVKQVKMDTRHPALNQFGNLFNRPIKADAFHFFRIILRRLKIVQQLARYMEIAEGAQPVDLRERNHRE